MNYQNRLPNFLTIDFYEVGDMLNVVNQLNVNYTNVNGISASSRRLMSVFPNPFSGITNIYIDKSVVYKRVSTSTF